MPSAEPFWVAGSTLDNGFRKSWAWAGVKAARWSWMKTGGGAPWQSISMWKM